MCLHFFVQTNSSKLCVSKVKVRQEVFSEAHSSAYSIHLKSSKMYKDLKQYFLWSRMKREIVMYQNF